MHFHKMKTNFVVRSFVIVLSFFVVSILSSPVHTYQDSDLNQAISIVEDESSAETLAEILLLTICIAQLDISQEEKAEILAEILQYDCVAIYDLAKFFDELDDLLPPVVIITDILWFLWDICTYFIKP